MRPLLALSCSDVRECTATKKHRRTAPGSALAGSSSCRSTAKTPRSSAKLVRARSRVLSPCPHPHLLLLQTTRPRTQSACAACTQCASVACVAVAKGNARKPGGTAGLASKHYAPALHQRIALPALAHYLVDSPSHVSTSTCATHECVLARVRILQEATKGNHGEGRPEGRGGGSGGRGWGGGQYGLGDAGTVGDRQGAGDKRGGSGVHDDEASLHPSWVAKKKQATGTWSLERCTPSLSLHLLGVHSMSTCTHAIMRQRGLLKSSLCMATLPWFRDWAQGGK